VELIMVLVLIDYFPELEIPGGSASLKIGRTEFSMKGPASRTNQIDSQEWEKIRNLPAVSRRLDKGILRLVGGGQPVQTIQTQPVQTIQTQTMQTYSALPAPVSTATSAPVAIETKTQPPEPEPLPLLIEQPAEKEPRKRKTTTTATLTSNEVPATADS
jgi:hypothetical protein